MRLHARRPIPCRLRSAALVAALSLGLPACLGRLPRPPTGPTPADALIEVPYPPPPARVEVVPPRKHDHEVWLDGQWDWDGSAWKWIPGSWATPPAGAYFAPWTTVRRSDGRLFFAPAAWRIEGGRALPAGPDRGYCAPSAEGEVRR